METTQDPQDSGSDYPVWVQGEAFAAQPDAASAAITPSAAEEPEGAPAPSAAPDALTAPQPRPDPAIARLQAERDQAVRIAQQAQVERQTLFQSLANQSLLDEQQRYANLEQRRAQGHLDPEDYVRERAVIDQRREVRQGIANNQRETLLQQREREAAEVIQIGQATALENARVAWVEQIGAQHGLTAQERRDLLDSRMDPDAMPTWAARIATGRQTTAVRSEAATRQANRADVAGGGGSQVSPGQPAYDSSDYYNSIPWTRR